MHSQHSSSCNNGKPVKTVDDWVKRRRPEVLELFADRKQVTIHFSAKPDGPKAEVLIYIPTDVRDR